MASNYPTVYYGSYGETVKQLQQALNQVGYSLDVDGGFGEKTRAAVSAGMVCGWTAWRAARPWGVCWPG